MALTKLRNRTYEPQPCRKAGKCRMFDSNRFGLGYQILPLVPKKLKDAAMWALHLYHVMQVRLRNEFLPHWN